MRFLERIRGPFNNPFLCIDERSSPGPQKPSIEDRGLSYGRPQIIAINHDDYHAEHVGKMADGIQFFLTCPFEAAVRGEVGCEYIALFQFDEDGDFLDAAIESLGPRGSYAMETKKEKYLSRLASFGDVEFCRIEVKPFSIEQYGVEFGIIVREPEDEDDVWAVILYPGNHMAFFEPWDTGVYDT